jgi:hypothetical protein
MKNFLLLALTAGALLLLIFSCRTKKINGSDDSTIFFSTKTATVIATGVSTIRTPGITSTVAGSATSTATADWYQIGASSMPSSTAEWTCLTGSGNTLYMVYKDTSDNYAKAITWDGTTWSSIGTISPGQVGQVASCISGSDVYAAFTDNSNSSKATVKKYSGGTWSVVGSRNFTPSSSFIWQQSLCVAGSDVYLVYSANSVGLMKFSGGSWTSVGPSIVAYGLAWYTTVAVDNAGTPYVSFQDSSYVLSSVVFNGSSWISSGTGLYTGTSEYINNASNNGSIYITYKETYSSTKAVVKKLAGSVWSDVGTQPFTDGAANGAMFAFEGNNIYVCYTDLSRSNKETVYKFDGTAWNNVGTPGFNNSATNWNSIYVNGGSVYIALRNATTGKAEVWKHN